tara:strand:+ start:436 stop:1554 length:1119 start_codon:yes stop_codon:yes gene_type:complete
MKINYNYLPEEFANVDDIFVDWKELIKSTEFTLGSFVEKFEDKFKSYIGVDYCISTNNGTDALILSLKSLGIGKGDQVITVANTFYATVGAIVAVGATPVLVDCDSRFQIDVNKIEEAINSKTKAVMPVHWGGASPDMIAIKKLCDKNNIQIVEDACMGIGAKVQGQNPGTIGNVNAFSMHPLKSLNAMGDGGMVVTNDKQLAMWMKKYRNHGMVDRDHIDFWGINMRLQPLQAVVASRGLDRLSDTIIKRNKNAKILDLGLIRLKEFVQVPERIENSTETFALYMALFKDRDGLKDYLISNEIEVKVHYPIPLNKQKAAKVNCIFNENELKNVNYQASSILTIPVHQFLLEGHMHFILEKIYTFYGKKYGN